MAFATDVKFIYGKNTLIIFLKKYILVFYHTNYKKQLLFYIAARQVNIKHYEAN